VGELVPFVVEDFGLLVNDNGITAIYAVYVVGKAQVIFKSNSHLCHYTGHKPE
jgi:hypothetical protein